MVERRGIHEVVYTNAGAIPVSEVAASLLANEQLVRDAAQLLQALFPELTVERVSVDFKTATTASPLKEILAYSLIVVYQEDLRREVPALIESLTGIDIPEGMDTLITVLVMVVAIYGVSAAYERFKPRRAGDTDGALPPSIQGNYNTIIQVSGDVLGVPPDQVDAAVKEHFKPKGKLTALAKRAISFIRPAKAEDGATVQGGGVELTADTIRDAPSAIDVAMHEDEDSQDPHTEVALIVHATDLDHMRQGWAGHLPGIVEKRTRMQLYPTVDAQSLFGKREVKADVVVVSRKNDRDEFVPYLILVVKVHE